MIPPDLADLNDWPFNEPPDTAAVATRYVLDGSLVVFVSRDREDGSWQFHAAEVAEVTDARMVPLHYIVTLDPSIKELADLPPGWEAERESVDADWIRARY